MGVLDLEKYNEMQENEMDKIYTPEMYNKEWDLTETLENELYNLLCNDDTEEFDKFIEENEPLATFDYISGCFNDRFIDGIPILPVRTLNRVKKQLTDKINILKLKNNI